MTLEIVSPEAKIFSGEITSVAAPGVDGSFQLLKNHAAIVSILKNGLIKIKANSFNISKEWTSKFNKVDSQNLELPITSGTLEMKNNQVIILVD